MVCATDCIVSWTCLIRSSYLLGFFEVLNPRMADFQFFRYFIFTNASAKSSALQWIVHFFEELDSRMINIPEIRGIYVPRKTNYTWQTTCIMMIISASGNAQQETP